MVLQLIFKSFILFDFIFVYGVSWWLSFIFFFFACSSPDLLTPFVEDAIFSPFDVPDPLSYINWIACFPGVVSGKFFIYFGDQTLVQGITSKYVFLYGWFSFHFVDVFFSHAEAL